MAAQDAELKLKVSLDLGFFRQQLAGLGQAAAGYSIPVQVKFDRRAVQNELNALGASIKRRDYRLTIQTNLKAEIDQARKLAQAFADLEKGAFTSPQPRQRGSFTKSAFRGMDLGDVRKLYKEAANAGLLSYDEEIAKNRRKTEEALYGLGKDSIAGLLNGLKSDNEKLKTAAKNLGKDLIASVKGVLGIASPSKEFKKIGEDSGEGFEQGLKSGLGEATRMGIKEMRELFRALQGEAQSGAARLQATMLAAMAGIVQLPGGRQQRGRLAQSASAINTAMTGAAAVNIGARQSGVRRQAAGAASATPAFMAALPMMFGMSERELTSRLQGLYGQQYRAPSIGGTRTGISSQLSSLVSSISGTRGPLGTGGGAIEQLFRGGAVNPGVLSSGYIGRSALSPKFVNYPAGMPPAYATGFIEPTAFGSLAAGTTGRYGMGGAAAFPSSPMMRGGIGAGGGSFIPMQEVAASSNRAKEAISGFTARLKNLADFVAGNQSLPISPAQQRQAAAWANSTRQGNLGSRFVGPSGNVQSYAGNFPVSGMMGPSSPLGRITAQSSMFGGGGGNIPPGGGGGGGGFGGMGGGQFRNLMGFGPSASPIDFSLFQQSRLPLSGAVRELGEEFGFAVKQVLLFGTAYKALAFLTNLPGEAFEAAKALANYRNQLDAVTSESGTFERSFAFVDDLAARFNVPLESARQGFVKLYASMEPAGFGPGQIENLFEGISKATAAFGLSADKVDRVNYAFAQMASKGQIMSEELKGQLGDVLPGALALFAEAAQMSIPEFSQAMEDGAFKGEAMQQVLDNVAVLMNNKFGPAAQNASKTLQGALNQIQNNLKLMYESMSPIVNQLAATFSPQINALINDVTSAVKALTGNFAEGSDVVSTLSPRAEALYSAFQQIVPSVAAAAQNIGNFVSSLQILAGPLLGVTKGMLDFISIPFVARVGLYATIIASLNAAFQLLAKTGIAQATVALVRFLATLNIAQINVYIAGIRTVIAVLGSMVTGAKIATAAVVGLKVALGLAFATAVIAGLDMLAQRVLNIGAAADSSKKSVREFAQELDRIAGSADVESATKVYMDANTELAKARKENAKALDDLRKAQEAPSGSLGLNVLEAQRKADEAYARVIEANTKVRQARQARDAAVRRQEESRNKVQQELKPIDLSAGDGEGTKGKRTPLNEILDRESQRQAEMASSDKMRRLSKLITDAKLLGNEAEAKSLENLSGALKISSNIQAAQKFLLMLIEKEDEIVGKSLTQKGYINKLEDAKVELYKLQNDLQVEFDKLQVKEADAAKDAVDGLTKKIEKQKELNRLVEDAQIAAGIISPQQAAIIQQRRGFEDAQAKVKTEGTPEQLAQLTQAQALIPQAGSMQEYIKKLRDELQQLISVQNLAAVSARGIGEALGNAMTNGVASLISGTATAKEVFADFLQSVGQALSQAASQMIATYIAIGVAKMFAGFGSFDKGAGIGEMVEMPSSVGIGSGGGIIQNRLNQGFGTFGPNFGIRQFATGGFVSGPTMGLIAEGGESEYIIPASKMQGAMSRYAAGARGSSVIPNGSSGMAGASNGSISSFTLETVVINNVEYATVDQVRAMGQQAAQQGAQGGFTRSMRTLQNSRSQRSKLGLR